MSSTQRPNRRALRAYADRIVAPWAPVLLAVLATGAAPANDTRREVA